LVLGSNPSGPTNFPIAEMLLTIPRV